MGQKTSVYLSDETAARAKASGLSIGELIRRGLDAIDPQYLETIVRRAVQEELTAILGNSGKQAP